MAKYRYIRALGIRELVKENKKRCGADFLHVFDCFIEEKVLDCCKQFNGHKTTLDATVANLKLRGGKT